jgi:subtilisin family serine protease
MPSFAGLPRPSRRLAVAVAIALLGSGCAPASAGRAGPGIVTASGSALGSAGSMAYVESATLSFALDRIDQRRLPLDHTYRHYGSGAGGTVYVFDGGVMENHPELAGRVRRGFDAFSGEARLCNAHGTAVAGAIAGATLGVAPEAEIVDVKMVECRTMRGSIDAIVRGTRWMLADVARHPGHRAVANWSFIADTAASIPALNDAVQSLLDAGVPVVVAAGNIDMNACRIAPGNVPGTIVVGASRVRAGASRGTLVDERTPGTAYGPCVDVFAPGDSVLLPSMDFGGRAVSQLWTGTSMSAGYVSGAVALYLESHPYATPDDVLREVHASSAGTVVDAKRTPYAGMLYVGTAERR